MNDTRRYRILEVVGRGSFGVVYRAELLGAGGFTKSVALKILTGKSEAEEEVELRLRDEARMLGLIRHPAVVQVDSLARLPDGWAIVMEYIDGVDVGALIASGPVPPRVALEVAEEVAGALHAAYALPSGVTGETLRLVHRDLKPSNIRVTSHGEVKVLDFGAARADFGSREASTLAWRFGTPRYMSPERHDGIEGPEGDIYGLALVLARMLTGEPCAAPPTHPNRHATFVHGILDQVWGPLRLAFPAHPDLSLVPVQRLLEEMLSFDPKGRPDARKVQHRCRDLAEALGGAPLRAWAEDAVPLVADQLPNLTTDVRCGSVLDERSGEITILGGDDGELMAVGPPAVVVQSDPTRTEPVPQWRNAAVGAALGMLLAVVVVVVWWPAAPPPAPRAEDAVVILAAPPILELDEAPPEAPVAAASDAIAPVASASRPRASAAAPPQEAAPADATPPADAPAVVSVSGVSEAWLESEAGRYPPGAVPAGTWRVMVRFEDEEPFPAGTFAAAAGERVSVQCSASLLRCRKEGP